MSRIVFVSLGAIIINSKIWRYFEYPILLRKLGFRNLRVGLYIGNRDIYHLIKSELEEHGIVVCPLCEEPARNFSLRTTDEDWYTSVVQGQSLDLVVTGTLQRANSCCRASCHQLMIQCFCSPGDSVRRTFLARVEKHCDKRTQNLAQQSLVHILRSLQVALKRSSPRTPGFHFNPLRTRIGPV